MSDGVEFRARDGSVRIRLDRPAQGNALGLAAAEALGAAAAAAADFDAEIDRTIASLVAVPTAALGAIRALLAASATTRLSDQLDAEAAGIGHAADGDEGRAGVDAFLVKRSPHFKSAAVA